MRKILEKISKRKNFLRFVLPVILVIILALIGFFSFHHPQKNLSAPAAQAKAEKFINDFLMQSGTKATIKSVTQEYGLYKMTIDIVSGQVESYVTKDGKLFFPQALDMDKIAAARNTPTGNATDSSTGADQSTTVTQKTTKPKVELFVMSYCPYGTQIEKGLLPVLAALGNKIDFQLKFVSYSMHGQKELAENLTQYCIEQGQPTKLDAYLSCFLQNGDSPTCLTQTGINQSQVNTCVAKTDKQYSVTSDFNNKVNYQGNYPGFAVNKADNEKYQVGGSPTLIINGQDINSGRDSASLLKTICSAFPTAPAECQATLSSATPDPGFGSSTSASAASTGGAGCGQ